MFKLRKQTEASTCGLPGMKPLFPESMVSGLSKCWGTNPCSHLAGRESASEPHLQPVICGLNTVCPYIRGKKTGRRLEPRETDSYGKRQRAFSMR